jgi:hypothetical protein
VVCLPGRGAAAERRDDGAVLGVEGVFAARFRRLKKRSHFGVVARLSGGGAVA